MASLVERLENWETVYPEDGGKTDAEICKEAADMIRRLLTIIEHAYPEETGSFFICGCGPIVDNGLPDRISVCPSFGADWAGVYVRYGKENMPEW